MLLLLHYRIFLYIFSFLLYSYLLPEKRSTTLSLTEPTLVANGYIEVNSPLLLASSLSSNNDRANSTSENCCGNIGQPQVYHKEKLLSLKDIAKEEESTLSPCTTTRSALAAQMQQQLQSHANTRNKNINQIMSSRIQIHQHSMRQRYAKVCLLFW